MGRCMKCSHYDICSDDRINSEEVWGQCRYFEDDSVPMVPKSDLEMYIKLYHEVEDELATTYDKLEQAETEMAKKIFSDIFENLPSRGEWNSQDIELGFEWGLAEARKSIKELKKKYKVEN